MYRKCLENFVIMKYYYENLSKRVKPHNKLKNKLIEPIDKANPQYVQRQVLKFKVKNFHKKIVLLRQHKIKKNTYLRIWINKAQSKFPQWSLSDIYESLINGGKSIISGLRRLNHSMMQSRMF